MSLSGVPCRLVKSSRCSFSKLRSLVERFVVPSCQIHVMSGEVMRGNHPQPLLRLSCRQESWFSRVPVRVHFPKSGKEVGAKQSLAELPPDESSTKEYGRRSVGVGSGSSGEVFKSVMGEIYCTKSKRLIAMEGAKVVEEAIKHGLNLKVLFLLKNLKVYPESVRNILESKADGKSGPEVHHVSQKILQEWSSVVTPPGIIGVFEKPSLSLLEKLRGSLSENRFRVPLTVVLDNIRDPGNLGSVLRTAAGIGCKVILSDGCVDPWNMKALRGGDGAQILVPITTNVDLRMFHQHISILDLTGDCASNQQVNTQEMSRSGIGVFLADSGLDEDRFGIPIQPYTSINYSKFKAIYVIFGGEKGLHASTRKAAVELKQFYGDDIKQVSRINIPMFMPVESLNVANSFGIIGYEIARQFSQ